VQSSHTAQVEGESVGFCTAFRSLIHSEQSSSSREEAAEPETVSFQGDRVALLNIELVRNTRWHGYHVHVSTHTGTSD
jgi:hypothetical protein